VSTIRDLLFFSVLAVAPAAPLLGVSRVLLVPATVHLPMGLFGSRWVITGNSKIGVAMLAGTGVYYLVPKTKPFLEWVLNLMSSEPAEVSLQALVDKVDRLESSSSPAVTIVSDRGGESGKGGSSFLIGVLGVGGVAFLLLWKSKYVTREHLTNVIHNMGDGLKSVTGTVDQLRGHVQEMASNLSWQVQDVQGKQDELHSEVGDLADAMEDLREDIKDIHDVVQDCEHQLLENAAKQEFTLRGIQLLCGVVADSLQPGTTRTQLEAFVKNAPVAGGELRLPGPSTPSRASTSPKRLAGPPPAYHRRSTSGSPGRRRRPNPSRRWSTPGSPLAPSRRPREDDLSSVSSFTDHGHQDGRFPGRSAFEFSSDDMSDGGGPEDAAPFGGASISSGTSTFAEMVPPSPLAS